MSKKDILNYENSIVSLDELETIWESPEVKEVNSCGNSGFKIGCTWWNAVFIDGEEISVYTK